MGFEEKSRKFGNKLTKVHLELFELEPRRNKLFQERNGPRPITDKWCDRSHLVKLSERLRTKYPILLFA